MLDAIDIWKFLAGLGILLIGLFFMEDALKNLAGRSFKRFLRQQTNQPVKAILSGILITAILQSSSVVSLMVLAFVGAGILKLKNAIGIIFGTNVGTTFTGWIVAAIGFRFNLESFALPMVAVGAIGWTLFVRKENIAQTGRFILGFGFLFVGLAYMKESFELFATQVDLSTVTGLNPYLFFLIGFVLTAIIQSSSASMVITLSALSSGMLSLDAAAAMVIGSDLGSTITTVLGATGGSAIKKQVAATHFLFNLVTNTVALILLYPLLYMLSNMLGSQDPLIILVAFHSSFNIMGIVILSPFINRIARFLEKRFTHAEQDQNRLEKVPADIPDVATETLFNETQQLQQALLHLNARALHLDHGFLQSNGQRQPTYAEEYDQLKRKEGALVRFYIRIQANRLNETENQRLNRCIHAIRHVMESAKDIKDVTHNIREYESSGNEAKAGIYDHMKSLQYSFYVEVFQLMESNEADAFERLVELKERNEEIFDQIQRTTYQQTALARLSELEISSLLNYNKQVYNANRSLLASVRDTYLTEQEAVDFSKLPVK